MSTVGIRELKQNASAVIAEVERGTVVEVTNRGRRVARIVPIPQDEDILTRLVAEGLATAPTEDLAKLPPPLPARRGAPLPSAVLEELRAEER